MLLKTNTEIDAGKQAAKHTKQEAEEPALGEPAVKGLEEFSAALAPTALELGAAFTPVHFQKHFLQMSRAGKTHFRCNLGIVTGT